MEKILPRGAAPQLTTAAKIEVSLAQNEKASFQVVVIPCERALKQVRINVGDLKTTDGKTFAAANVEAPLVGYVETKRAPPYGSPAIGWWPDPILNFLKSSDIAVGDAQAFWVRVRAPKDQPAGSYQGKATIEMDGAATFAFELTVRVRAFCLPDRSPLPLAVTFAPMFIEEGGKEGKYQNPAWLKHKLEWGDFLADYYLTYDSLYHSEMPEFEVLQRLAKQGRLGMFNLGYYGQADENPAALEKWKESTLGRLRAAYDRAKGLGLLPHAYIYGCDEAPAKLFPAVQRAAELIKAACPDVLVMTTTYDHSFGTNSVIKSMDAFCPLTQKFDAALAAKSRAAGKQVWWYICCGPHHPYANMFIEYPAIEGRLLMGPMTAKYRPDGFLYYEISIWNSPPIESGPFTTWNPRSWTTYHGDGSWTCLGPDGTPLPTVRLENFRDGLQDYAYFRILEATAAKIEASAELRAEKAEWLQKAKVLLTVPATLVKSLTEYSRDPAELYRYRAALGDAIEAAGTPPAYPWQADK
ncbi:MAG: glycoside hydrolase domain-containing protein, partial [Planctomycetota bacterium]